MCENRASEQRSLFKLLMNAVENAHALFIEDSKRICIQFKDGTIKYSTGFPKISLVRGWLEKYLEVTIK